MKNKKQNKKHSVNVVVYARTSTNTPIGYKRSMPQQRPQLELIWKLMKDEFYAGNILRLYISNLERFHRSEKAKQVWARKKQA